jgi:D-alanyl-D-alanine dipeptidase
MPAPTTTTLATRKGYRWQLDEYVQAVPLTLPDYAWASVDPAAVAVPPGPWGMTLHPVEVKAAAMPLPDSPIGEPDGLVEVQHPRIRVLGAYWHEGWPHAVPGAWLRPPVLERVRAAVDLLPSGFGLAVYDAWRDPRLQAVLHDRVYEDDTLPPGFVAYPSADPRECPPHASGGTVDLTLTWRGHALALGTHFDAFVPQAAAAGLEPDGPALARDLRRLQAAVMGRAGFVQHPQEWWHWEFGTRYWAAARGEPVLYGHAGPPPDAR